MSIGPVALPVMPTIPLTTTVANPIVASSAGAAGEGFSNALSSGLQNLQQLQSASDNLAVQAATGSLTNVHDYMIAATKASLATDLTVTLRNKAVDAFNEILRMQV